MSRPFLIGNRSALLPVSPPPAPPPSPPSLNITRRTSAAISIHCTISGGRFSRVRLSSPPPSPPPPPCPSLYFTSMRSRHFRAIAPLLLVSSVRDRTYVVFLHLAASTFLPSPIFRAGALVRPTPPSVEGGGGSGLARKGCAKNFPQWMREKGAETVALSASRAVGRPQAKEL